jgi:hypothetical protein
METERQGSEEALWSSRYLTNGQIVIAGRTPIARRTDTSGWVQARGRDWRRLERWQQWVLAVVTWVVLSNVWAVLGLVFIAGMLVFLRVTREPVRVPQSQPALLSPEALLAASNSVEAKVAGAATRAWAETLREPSWQSPYLASTRAAFDGEAEVDQIVALAVRIRSTRDELGARPSGPAGEYWDRQQAALDKAARRLGSRADALIRHRDQAAQLSVELQHLTDLERLERSAADVDALTIETAHTSGRGDGGMGDVADEMAGVRQAMTELLDLMTRTRAPLAQPPDSSAFPH